MAPSRGIASNMSTRHLFTPPVRQCLRPPRPHPRPHHPHIHRVANFSTSRTHSSSSSSSSSAVIETAIESVASGISSLHHVVGLPWYVALPLSAAAIRTVVVLPLQLVAARNRKQRTALTPAVLAARPELERKVLAKYGHLGPEKCTRHLAYELAKKREELRTRAEIGRWQAWAPLMQLPVWILAIETVRRMCGTDTGLLGMMMMGRKEASGGGEAAATAGGGGDAALGGAEAQVFVDGAAEATNTLVAAAAAAADTISNHDLLYEPSLAAGGCLWFPDLLVPDPQVVLPFALSGLIFGSVAWEDRRMEALGIARPRWSVGLSRGLKIVALAVGPLTMNLPAGMLVYWIGSAGTALSQKYVVDMLVPIDRAPVMEAMEKDRLRIQTPRGNEAPAAPSAKKYVPMRKASRKR